MSAEVSSDSMYWHIERCCSLENLTSGSIKFQIIIQKLNVVTVRLYLKTHLTLIFAGINIRIFVLGINQNTCVLPYIVMTECRCRNSLTCHQCHHQESHYCTVTVNCNLDFASYLSIFTHFNETKKYVWSKMCRNYENITSDAK